MSIVYRPGKDVCPECDTAIYHKNSCVLGAVLRENAERGAKLCRAMILLREVVDAVKLEPAMNNIKYDVLGAKVLATLSSTGPCRHEEEAKRLREAVEWALQNGDEIVCYGGESIGWKAELRRRAKEMGK